MAKPDTVGVKSFAREQVRVKLKSMT